ncbi:MAG: DUF4388 domain-containing protein, partial [Sandaracinaceae bacterium]|nr:DUF4388 domain-containing protein [Sandaracinaceae bacterium]
VRALEGKSRGFWAQRRGRYEVVGDAGGELLILKRHPERKLLMAGEIVAKTMILEVINIAASTGWRGELYICSPEATRVLGIDQGVLRYARSDHPDDRLGQVIYRNGLISRAELDELLEAIEPDRRIGHLLIERKILTQEQLFQQLQKQVEQIFFSALVVQSGVYAFLSEDPSNAPAHTVHIPIPGLLMEGVQRIDEMALFRERIPHDDWVPEIQQRISLVDLDDNAKLVLVYADGTRSIEEIARESGLGIFHTLKAIYGLLQQGLIVLRPPRKVDPQTARRLVEEINSILRDIFLAAAAYGAVARTRTAIETWMLGSDYVRILGAHLEEDGSLVPEQVLRALENAGLERPMEALVQALHELASFALFAVTATLPREQGAILSREVSQRLKRIRI